MGDTIRTGIRLALVLAFVGIISVSCRGERRTATEERARSPQETATGPNKGKLKMHQLELAISTARAEALPDESMMIQVTLANKDSALIEVPDPESVCVFEFIVRSKTDSANVHFLDAASAFEAHTGDEKPPRDPAMKALEPGTHASYDYDLAQFYLEPLRPDAYDVSVRYRKDADVWESPPASLAIVPPKIEALAAIYGPTEQNLGHIFANREEDGSTTICQRESFYNKPYCGILYRRIHLNSNETVASVADAIEMYYNRGIRWFAWLEDGALRAAVAQERTLFGQVDPISLELQSPIMYQRGWQLEDELAMFAILGQSKEGRVACIPASLPVAEGESLKYVPLSISTMPVQWGAQLHGAEDNQQFVIVTAQDNGGTIRLGAQTVDRKAETATPPVTLAERAEPLAALALEPVAGDESNVVDVLFGPVGEERRMTFLRLPLDGGEPVNEWTLHAPLDEEGQAQLSQWAITPQSVPVPMVMMKFGNRLMARAVADGAEWIMVADDAADAEYIHLEVLGDGRVWAVWADPRIGLRYLAIR
jgi:hypothetical protein